MIYLPYRNVFVMMSVGHSGAFLFPLRDMDTSTPSSTYFDGDLQSPQTMDIVYVGDPIITSGTTSTLYNNTGYYTNVLLMGIFFISVLSFLRSLFHINTGNVKYR